MRQSLDPCLAAFPVPLFENLFKANDNVLHTLFTGALEKPPKTLKDFGCFTLGSHMAPNRSPPNGS